MDQLRHLEGFFKAIEGDPYISVTHIGVYAAILKYWKEKEFKNPFYAFSHEIMPIAKISASSTYYKVVKELSNYGYLRYEASFKRNKGSKIFMLSLETSRDEGFGHVWSINDASYLSTSLNCKNVH